MAASFAPKALRLTSSSRKRLFSTVVDDRLGSTMIPAGGAAPAAATPTSALSAACTARAARNAWTKDEIREIYNTPLMELAFKAVSHSSTFNTGSSWN
jgi:biotin synthase